MDSDNKVVNPKKKTKLLLINETQEDDRFAIDEEYDIVTEKKYISYYLWDVFWVFPLKKYSLNPVKLKSNHIFEFRNRQNY